MPGTSQPLPPVTENTPAQVLASIQTDDTKTAVTHAQTPTMDSYGGRLTA